MTLETTPVEAANLIVGEFALNLSTGELERDGVRTRLQDKPFQVLRMLAEQAGELVTREQLFERLWPRGTYVEFEMGLNTAVRKLRTALQDDPETPRYIETLPRRGYRLLATVRSATTSGQGNELQERPVTPPAAILNDVGAEARDTGPHALAAQTADLTLPNAAGERVAEAALDAPAFADRPAGLSARWWVTLGAALVVGAGAYLLSQGFRLSRSGTNLHATAAVTPAQEVAQPVASEQSIAVLPFADMSERKDQEYFSDGLSEELIELLGKTPGLRVIARTSSFHFKGGTEKLETIAQELHVANVLEGSVRKSGNRLRVTAKLIRVQTSEHLWSETFDRDLHDVFKVQDEIAGAVATALRIHLLPVQPSASQQPLPTANLEAYNLYLLGRQGYNQGDAAGFQRAVTAFRAATALDPHYAAAYADLALAQFWLADNTVDQEGYQSAVAAAEQAVALAPGSAAAYSARGFLRAVVQFDFAGGQADLNRAVALSPQDAVVLHRSAVVLGILGDLPAALAREEAALALDPLSEEICRRLGFFFAADRQFARARPLYEKALAIAPNSNRARNNLADLDLLDHRPEQALVGFRQTGLLDFNLAGQAKGEYELGHRAASQEILERLIARSADTPSQIAGVYAWRGEPNLAFEWLERAYAQRDPGITWLKIDPTFRNLRTDPRFKPFLQKMKLPE